MAECTRAFVAGHRGMVGAAIVRRLASEPVDVIVRSRSELDLRDQAAVSRFFAETPFDHVYLAAAKVGGIHANSAYPADFIAENLAIQDNVIAAAHASGVSRLLFLGSSCIYPRDAAQPMREDALLTGPLEETNKPYAIAKIAGIVMCESFNRQHGTDYRCVMPTNLYGPGDNYHGENSHVIPALIRRFHEATLAGSTSVAIWGSGTPRREFLHVDDMADACVFVMGLPRGALDGVSHLNIGAGEDISIAELAALIAEVTGFTGAIETDASKLDGTPQKLLDVGALAGRGWQRAIALREGLAATYADFVANGSSRLN